MVVNRQRRVGVDLAALRNYVVRLDAELGLGRLEFNVCLADDREVRRLNALYRGKRHPTDVLSFPWSQGRGANGRKGGTVARSVPDRARLSLRGTAGRAQPSRFQREFRDFLGDIVISAETARRNARVAGHSTVKEIRRLILHGVLHLMGYDHETDAGQMAALEADLRRRLGLSE